MSKPRRSLRNTKRRAEMVTDALVTLRLLLVGRWLIADLAAAIGHQRRTAYRLLAAIERAGIRVERQKEGREVYLRVRREDVERTMGLR
ncbi:MAG: hypothetical protein ACK4N5_09940 [Myxococcales bacterium]